ncbi:MAG: hypothetical protein ACYCSG_06655 [Thermoplasmataceae archaeon]
MVSKSSKTIALTLLVVIIASWLLISSISNLQPIQSGINGPTSGPGAASTGSGSGSGGGGSGGTNGGNLFNFKLPNFNFNLPSFKSLSLLIPNIPTFNIPFIHFTLPKFNLNIFGSPRNNAKKSPGQASGSTSGAGGKTTTNNPINPLMINEDLILIIIAIVASAMAIWFLMKIKRGGAFEKREKIKKIRSKDPEFEVEDLVLEPEIEDLKPNMQDEHRMYSPFLFGNGETAMKGWGGKGMIRPMIAEDLPLSWSLNNPLGLAIDDNIRVELNGLEVARKDGNHVYIRLKANCNKITGKSGITGDTKIIRGVDYESDIRDVFRLNMKDYLNKSNQTLTFREIAKSSDELKKGIKRNEDFQRALYTFEKIFYGSKDADRAIYEMFLRGMMHGIYNPIIFTCGDN